MALRPARALASALQLIGRDATAGASLAAATGHGDLRASGAGSCACSCRGASSLACPQHSTPAASTSVSASASSALLMRIGFHSTAKSQQPALPWLAQQFSLSSPTHITPSSQPIFLRGLSDPAKAVHKGTGQARPNSTGVPPVKPRGPPQPKPPAQAAKETAGKPGGIKELHFRVKTEEKDTQTKMRRVEGWLEHGIRSKLVVKFKVGDADEALAASQLLDALLGRLAGKGSPQGAKQQVKDTWSVLVKPLAPPAKQKQQEAPPQAADQAAPQGTQQASAV